jgi:signal transduction histidine kinase
MSDIDGRQVNYRDLKDKDDNPVWEGLVMGDSGTPGWVRVHWAKPKNQISPHKVTDLVVIDSPPSQEELRKMYHG